MPQMAPLMWLNLLFLFLISLFMFMIMNYFNFLPKKKSISLKFNFLLKKPWSW